MQVAATVVYSPEDAAPHLSTTEYLVVVLTKGVLQDPAFAEVVLVFEWARQAEPVDILTVLAESNFLFPAPEFYADLENEGERGSRVAAGFRRLMNILALPFSPHGSLGIMNTQAGEICRRFRRCGLWQHAP